MNLTSQLTFSTNKTLPGSTVHSLQSHILVITLIALMAVVVFVVLILAGLKYFYFNRNHDLSEAMCQNTELQTLKLQVRLALNYKFYFDLPRYLKNQTTTSFFRKTNGTRWGRIIAEVKISYTFVLVRKKQFKCNYNHSRLYYNNFYVIFSGFYVIMKATKLPRVTSRLYIMDA